MEVGDLVRPILSNPCRAYGARDLEIEGDLGVVVAVEISQPSGATTYRVFWTGINRYMTYWTKDYLEVVNA